MVILTVRFGPQQCHLRAHLDTSLGEVIRVARHELPDIPSIRHLLAFANQQRATFSARLRDLGMHAPVGDVILRVRSMALKNATRASARLITALYGAATPGCGLLDAAQRQRLDALIAHAQRCCAEAPIPVAPNGVLPFGSKTPFVYAARCAVHRMHGPGAVPPSLDAGLQPWAWRTCIDIVRKDLRVSLDMTEAPGRVTSDQLALALFGVHTTVCAALHGGINAAETGTTSAQLLGHLSTFLSDVYRTRKSPLSSVGDHLALRDLVLGLCTLVLQVPSEADARAAVRAARSALDSLQGVWHVYQVPCLQEPPPPPQDDANAVAVDGGEPTVNDVNIMMSLFPELPVYVPGAQEQTETDDDMDVTVEHIARLLSAPPGSPAAVQQPPVAAGAPAVQGSDGYALNNLGPEPAYGPDRITLRVDRDELLTSSMRELDALDPDRLRNPRAMIEVWFANESGFGLGVVRDWVSAVFTELSNPDLGLFVRAPADPRTLLPSPYGPDLYPARRRRYDVERAQDEDEDEPADFDQWMEFTGRMLGIAARLRVPVGYHLGAATLRMVQCQPVGLADLQEVDPQVARCCALVLSAASKTEELEAMALPGFVVPDLRGALRPPAAPSEVALLPGGDAVPVRTAAGAYLFTHLCAEHYCGRWGVAHHAAAAIRRGLLSMSNTQQPAVLVWGLAQMRVSALNALLGGAQCVPVDRWRALTSMVHYHDIASGPVAVDPRAVEANAQATEQAFWAAVERMSTATRRLLLRFWTGCLSLPEWASGDDAGVRLQLRIILTNDVRFPVAHTCFRQLTLVAPPPPGPTLSVQNMYRILTAVLRLEDGCIEDP